MIFKGRRGRGNSSNGGKDIFCYDDSSNFNANSFELDLGDNEVHTKSGE